MPYEATQAWQETVEQLKGERSNGVKENTQTDKEVDDTAMNPKMKKFEKPVEKVEPPVEPSPPASNVQASISQHEVKESQTPAPNEVEVAQKSAIERLLDEEAREGEHVSV